MNEFKVEGYFLDRQYLSGNYNSIIRNLSYTSRQIDNVIYRLSRYSGAGIESRVSQLRRYNSDIKRCIENVRAEYSSVSRMIELINFGENRAAQLLGDVSSGYDMKEYEWNETVIMSHDDLEKLVEELKYYSSNPGFSWMYKMISRMYDKGTDCPITKEAYRKLHNAYDEYMKKYSESYIYSGIKFFDGSGDTKVSGILFNNGKYEFKAKDKNNKISLSSELDIASLKASANGYAMQFEYAAKYGNDTVRTTITLDNVDLSAEVLANITTGTYTDVLENIINKKSNIYSVSSGLAKLGIEFDASISALKIEQTTTKYINENVSYYDTMEYKIGELYAKAGLSTDGVEAKFGASIASVTTNQGLIINDKKTGVIGGLSGGIEGGFSSKGGKKSVSGGIFTAGFDIEDQKKPETYKWLDI